MKIRINESELRNIVSKIVTETIQEIGPKAVATALNNKRTDTLAGRQKQNIFNYYVDKFKSMQIVDCDGNATTINDIRMPSDNYLIISYPCKEVTMSVRINLDARKYELLVDDEIISNKALPRRNAVVFAKIINDIMDVFKERYQYNKRIQDFEPINAHFFQIQ